MATRATTQTTKPIRELYLRRNVEGLICDQVSPLVLVNETDKKGKYYRVSDDNIVLENDTILSSRAGATETTHGYESAEYEIHTHALKEWIDSDIYSFSDPIIRQEGRQDTILNIKDKLLIKKEKDLADILTNASNFSGHTTTLSGTNQWDNAASDPLANFITAAKTIKDEGGYLVNSLILGFEVMLGLQYNPAILDLLGDNSNKAVTKAVLSQLLHSAGVNIPENNIYVSMGQYKTIASGSASYIFGKDALFAYIDKRQNTKRGDTLIKTFGFKGNAGDKYQFFDDADKTKKGEWASGEISYGHELVNYKLGYLFKSAVS